MFTVLHDQAQLFTVRFFRVLVVVRVYRLAARLLEGRDRQEMVAFLKSKACAQQGLTNPVHIQEAS